MPTLDREAWSVLRLSLTPGLGPVRVAAMIERFGSATAAFDASPAELKGIGRLGDAGARKVAEGLRRSEQLAFEEDALAQSLGVTIVPKGSQGYPTTLACLPDSPPVLYVRGEIRGDSDDRFGVAIVGSRECSAYGVEQAERFAGVLASSGLCVVSGGARGIDSASHRGALRAGGRTIAVLGCGLSMCYPPENAELFDRIARQGAVVSELPLRTAPSADNFPARNRIISGLALGVLVIEASVGSGALITAKVAAEDHAREVFVLPGRVDSPASAGSLELLKLGGGLLVTAPGDVISALESPARHRDSGTHADRFPARESSLFPDATPSPALPTSAEGSAILAALNEPLTMDELIRETRLSPSQVRSALTLLELQKRVARRGSRLERLSAPR